MHKIPRNNGEPQIRVPPLRPIVSSIGAYNYNLAKYLTGLLSPHIPMDHCTADSFTFVQDLHKVSSQNQFLVSFDVVSLFTNIPLRAVSYTHLRAHETKANLVCRLLLEKKKK